MHLTKIKLAGFNSLVDPTTVPLPSQLVGVVGPNGCGKSNIIDCVRWVMGESSARYLRGETMTDVILDRKSTRLNSSHVAISYAVFCLKKKKEITSRPRHKSQHV